MRRLRILGLVGLCSVADLSAQSGSVANRPPADRMSSLLHNQLTLVEQDVVSLADAMPAEKYDFRPTAGAFTGVRTFGEQVRHLATMMFMTAAIVLEERSPYGPGINDNGPDDVIGKAAIIDYLKAAITYSRKAAAFVNEKNALDPLKTYFGSQPRLEIAEGLAYHSYDHYGQMVVYARLNGIVPPASRPR